MGSFFAGQKIMVAVPLVVGGVAVSAPEEATFTVTDQRGMTLLEGSPTSVGAEGAIVELPEHVNTLDYQTKRGYRQITVRFVVDGNTHFAHYEFLLESSDLLEAGVNSFQSYGEALLTAADLTGVDAFNTADRTERIRGLVNAHTNLTTMRFAVDRQRMNLDLSRLPPADFRNLPERFVRRLRQAQVIEAAEALTSFSIHRKRQSGLMSETIGESSMMFRPEKVLMIPVTRRTLELLGNYLSWEVSIGRS